MIELIYKFLTERRIALIGVSRKPKHFSRMVMADYIGRGYEVVPVNPNLAELDGKPCWKSVAEITPTPNAAMVMVPASALVSVVKESIDAGVKLIWLVRGENDADARKSAVALCKAQGIGVIDAACPLMYLEGTAFPHKIHGWIWKLVGMWGK